MRKSYNMVSININTNVRGKIDIKKSTVISRAPGYKILETRLNSYHLTNESVIHIK